MLLAATPESVRNLPSIRARLARSVLAITLIWCVAIAVVVSVVVRSEVDRLLDGALQESSEILFGLMSHHVDQASPTDEILPAPPHEEGLVWQLVDWTGQVRMRSHHAPKEPLGELHASGFSDFGSEWRVYSMRLDSRSLVLHVAQSRDHREAARLGATAMASGTALLIGFLAALWLRYRVADETRHVVALSQVLRNYDPVSPSAAPLPEVTRAELIPIRDAVSALAARLAQRIANERAFSAHAAHALRTPLAGMDVQLSVALRESPPECHPRLLKARLANERLRRVVTALLTMFRAGHDPHPAAIDMEDLIVNIPVDGLEVHLEGQDQLVADPDLLSAAVLNLLDNAVRYGARNMHVRWQRDATTGLQELYFSDDGPGVGGERLQYLQQVLDLQEYHQIGLGLTLTDLVARAHGGRARVAHNPKGGFVVQVQLLKPAPGKI